LRETTKGRRPEMIHFAAPFTSLAQTVAAVENGGAFGGQGFFGISVQIDGIVTNDIVQIEAKNVDELAFVQVGSDIIADGLYAVEPGSRYYRAIVSDKTGGGLISAVFVGSD
jgi:hypothetical protein